jgi:hypothetical protein
MCELENCAVYFRLLELMILFNIFNILFNSANKWHI